MVPVRSAAHHSALYNQPLVATLIEKYQGSVCGHELHMPGKDLWAVVLPDLSCAGLSFKIQYFSLACLNGHDAGYASAEDALRAVINSGYTEEASGILSRLIKSESWRNTYDFRVKN